MFIYFSGRIGALISMHAYSQLFIYPYSNQRGSYPPDIDGNIKATCQLYVLVYGVKLLRRSKSEIGTNFEDHFLVSYFMNRSLNSHTLNFLVFVNLVTRIFLAPLNYHTATLHCFCFYTWTKSIITFFRW